MKVIYNVRNSDGNITTIPSARNYLWGNDNE